MHSNAILTATESSFNAPKHMTDHASGGGSTEGSFEDLLMATERPPMDESQSVDREPATDNPRYDYDDDWQERRDEPTESSSDEPTAIPTDDLVTTASVFQKLDAALSTNFDAGDGVLVSVTPREPLGSSVLTPSSLNTPENNENPLPAATTQSQVHQAAEQLTKTQQSATGDHSVAAPPSSKASTVEQAVSAATSPSSASQLAASEQMLEGSQRKATNQVSERDFPAKFPELLKSDGSISLTVRQSTSSSLSVMTNPTLSPALAASLNQLAANGSANGQGQPASGSILGDGAVLESATAKPSLETKGFSSQLNSSTVLSGSASIDPGTGLPTPWSFGSLLGGAATGLMQPQPGSFAGLMGTASMGTTPTLATSTAAQSPGEQISIQVAKSAGGMPSKIDIDLKPEALGRVEIRLDLTQDGHVAARILAENPETLEILRAEAASLERALTDAGLKSESGDLQFDLKDRQQHTDRDGGHAGKDTSSEDLTSESQQGARVLSTPRDADGMSSGIDIQA